MDVDRIDEIIDGSPINPKNSHHVIFSTIISGSYKYLLEFAINSALKNNITNSELIVFSLDEECHNWCLKKKINSIFFNISSRINLNQWTNVGRLKQVIQYYFICKNCDVVFFDSDMIFGGNFKHDLIQKVNEGIDIQLMDETHEPRKEIDIFKIGNYNIGFMVVRASQNMLELFKYWLHICYDTDKDLWDQGIFNQIMGSSKVIQRDNLSKLIYYQHKFGTQIYYNFTVHLICPVKHINYCNLINETANRFSKHKVDQIISYSKDFHLISPNLVHFACIEGRWKKNFVVNMTLDQQTYEYYMNHLMNYRFI